MNVSISMKELVDTFMATILLPNLSMTAPVMRFRHTMVTVTVSPPDLPNVYIMHSAGIRAGLYIGQFSLRTLWSPEKLRRPYILIENSGQMRYNIVAGYAMFRVQIFHCG